jgi:hypothetical protein
MYVMKGMVIVLLVVRQVCGSGGLFGCGPAHVQTGYLHRFLIHSTKGLIISAAKKAIFIHSLNGRESVFLFLFFIFYFIKLLLINFNLIIRFFFSFFSLFFFNFVMLFYS